MAVAPVLIAARADVSWAAAPKRLKNVQKMLWQGLETGRGVSAGGAAWSRGPGGPFAYALVCPCLTDTTAEAPDYQRKA